MDETSRGQSSKTHGFGMVDNMYFFSKQIHVIVFFLQGVAAKGCCHGVQNMLHRNWPLPLLSAVVQYQSPGNHYHANDMCIYRHIYKYLHNW